MMVLSSASLLICMLLTACYLHQQVSCCDCIVSDWTSWSACSVNCGTRLLQQYRNRTVLQQPDSGGLPCPPLTENQTCSNQSVNCTFGIWTAWNACSVSCGSGTQYRNRTLTCGTPCPLLTENQTCVHTPVNCTVGIWTAWGTCSVSCGSGIQFRNRTVTQKPDSCGTPCPPLSDNQTCTYQPVNCTVGIWNAWGTCSVSCGSGFQSRRRIVTTQPNYCGTACPTLIENQLCTQQPYINCAVDDWTPWSDCSVSCGPGVQYRSRTVTQQPNDCGSPCPPLTDSQTCDPVTDCANTNVSNAGLPCCPKHECHAHNDPHMLTFDGRYWEFHIEGTYIMYRHNSLPLEVQAKFSACPWYWPGKTCVCAVAIRSWRAVFVVQYCDGYSMATYGPNDGTMIIERPWPTLWYFKVTLFTGTVIKFSPMWIYIFSSLSDYSQVKGLCGDHNGICEDDFTLRDSTLSSAPYADYCWYYYQSFDDFGESWRVSDDSENLFFYPYFEDDTFCPVNLFYCACQLPEYNPEVFQSTTLSYFGSVCDAIAHQQACADPRYDITNDVFSNCQYGCYSYQPYTGNYGRKRRNVGDMDQFLWECEEIINDSVVRLCIEAGILTQDKVLAAIQNCKDDIEVSYNNYYAPNNYYTPSYVAGLQEVCAELSSVIQPCDSTSAEALSQLYSVILCPGVCNLQSECVEGECRCNNGYPYGSDCGLTGADG